MDMNHLLFSQSIVFSCAPNVWWINFSSPSNKWMLEIMYYLQRAKNNGQFPLCHANHIRVICARALIIFFMICGWIDSHWLPGINCTNYLIGIRRHRMKGGKSIGKWFIKYAFVMLSTHASRSCTAGNQNIEIFYARFWPLFLSLWLHNFCRKHRIEHQPSERPIF